MHSSDRTENHFFLHCHLGPEMRGGGTRLSFTDYVFTVSSSVLTRHLLRLPFRTRRRGAPGRLSRSFGNRAQRPESARLLGPGREGEVGAALGAGPAPSSHLGSQCHRQTPGGLEGCPLTSLRLSLAPNLLLRR